MLELLELLPPPQPRHAMVVHIPIAMGLVGVVPLAMAACTGFRSIPLRAVAIACLLIASAGAFAAAHTGRQAAEAVRVQQGPLTQREELKLATHEHRGGIACVWPLAAATLVGATFIRRRAARIIAGPLSLLAGLGVAVWLSVIGHVGGGLVYKHGLGVPQREAASIHASQGDHPPDND